MNIGELRFQNRISDSLLLFYIAISTNFLLDLYPREHIDFINKNYFIKHLLGFITMLFSIYQISSIQNPTQVLILTFFLYSWFLLTTQLPPLINIMIVISLALGYLINIKIYHMEKINYNDSTKHQIYTLRRMVVFIFVFVIALTTFGYIYKMLLSEK